MKTQPKARPANASSKGYDYSAKVKAECKNPKPTNTRMLYPGKGTPQKK